MSDFNVIAQVLLQRPTNLSSVTSDIQRSLKDISANVDVRMDGAATARIQRQLIDIQSNLKAVSAGATSATSSIGQLGNTFGSARTNVASFTGSLGAGMTSLRGVASATTAAGSALDKFGEITALSTRRMGAFLLGAGSLLAVAHGIKSGIGDAVQFQNQMVKVGQVTSQSAGSIQALQEKITSLATGFGVSSKQLSQVSVTLSQTGISAREVSRALEGLAESTLSPSFGPLSRSVELAIVSMAAFKVKAEDVREVLGSVNQISADFAVESDDIARAASKMGGAFAQFSSGTQGLREMAALFTSVRANSRESSEEISTGLRNIFQRFQRPAVVEDLKALGISLRDAKNQYVGNFEAVRRLSEGLKSIPKTDPRFAQVTEQLGGLRQASRLIPLLENNAQAQAALNSAQAGGVSLTVSTERAQESLIVKLSRLKEVYADLFRQFADSKGFQSAADAFISLSGSAATLIGSLKPLIPILTTLGALKLSQNLTAGLLSPTGGIARAFSRGLLQRSSGGIVTGTGHSDSVPALLTPHEFVVNANSTRANLGLLQAINSGSGIRRFAQGGLVGGSLVSPSVRNQLGDPSLISQVEAAAQKLGITITSLDQVIRGFVEGIGPVISGVQPLAVKSASSLKENLRAASLSPQERGVVAAQVEQNSPLIGTILQKLNIRPGTEKYDSANQTGLVALNRLISKLVVEGTVTGDTKNLSGLGAGTTIARDIIAEMKKEGRRKEVSLPTGFETASRDRGPLAGLIHRERLNQAARLAIGYGVDVPEGLSPPQPPRLPSPAQPVQRLLGYEPPNTSLIKYTGGPGVHVTGGYPLQAPVETAPRNFINTFFGAATQTGAPPLSHPSLPILYGRADYDQARGRSETARLASASRPQGSQSGRFGSYKHDEYFVRPTDKQELLAEQDRLIKEGVAFRKQNVRGSNRLNTDPLAAKQAIAEAIATYQNPTSSSGTRSQDLLAAYRAHSGTLSSAQQEQYRARINGVLGADVLSTQRGTSAFGRFQNAAGRTLSSTLGISRQAAGGLGRLAGSFGLPIAASYLGEGVSSSAGPVDTAIAGGAGGEASFRRTRAAGGGLTGAALGATVGFSVGGPAGAGIGAAVVGLYSFASSLKEAEREIRSTKISESLSSFADKLNSLGINGAADFGSADAANKNLATYRQQSFERNKGEATGFFSGFDQKTFQALEQKSNRQDFGSQLPQIASALGKQAESLGRSNVGENVQKLTQDLRAGGNGLNSELLRISASVRNVPISKVLEEYAKSIESGQKAALSERRTLDARVAQESVTNSFGRLTLSVQIAADVFHQLQTGAESLSHDLFNGSVSASHVNLHGDRIGQLGRHDAGALQPLLSVAGIGGSAGRDLLQTGTVLDNVSRILPHALIQAGVNPAGGEDASTAVGRSLRSQLGGVKGSEAIISTIVSELDKLGDKVYEELKVDPAKFAEKLLDPAASAFKEASQKIVGILQEGANSYTTGLAAYRSQRASIGEGIDQTSRAGLASLRIQKGFEAYNSGNPGKALDSLSLQQLNQPFDARQTRLAGNLSDPRAIGQALAQTRIDVRAAQTRLNGSGGVGPEFQAAAQSLNSLKDQAANLQQALKHLTDAGERSAGAQEKLSHLENERSSRLNLGEHLLTADPGQRSQFNRGLTLAASAQKQGSFKGLTNTQTKLAIDALNQVGHAPLRGLPGQPIATDLKNKLLEGSGFGLQDEQKNEQKEFQNQIAKSFSEAEKAMDEMRKNQQSVSDAFFTSLQENQTQFLSRLGTELTKDTITAKQNEAGKKSVDLKDLRGLDASRKVLAGVGVKNSNQLAALTSRRSDIDKLENAENESNKQLSRYGDVSQAIKGSTLSIPGQLGINNRVFDPSHADGRGVSLSAESQAEITAKTNKFLQEKGLDQTQAGRVTGLFNDALGSRKSNLTGAARDQELSQLLNRSLYQGLTGKGSELEGAAKDKYDATKSLSTIKGLDPGKFDNPAAIKAAMDSFQNSGTSLENLDKKLETTAGEFEKLNKEIADLRAGLGAPQVALGANPVGLANGGFAPRGTDTIPAMLSPNEFVVNARSAQANAGILREINSGAQYYADGGTVAGREELRRKYRIIAINSQRRQRGDNEPFDASTVSERSWRGDTKIQEDRFKKSFVNGDYDSDAARANGLRGAVTKANRGRGAGSGLPTDLLREAAANGGGMAALMLAGRGGPGASAAAHAQAGGGNLYLRQLLAGSVDPGAAFGAGRADFGGQNRLFDNSIHRIQAHNDDAARQDQGFQNYLSGRGISQPRGGGHQFQLRQPLNVRGHTITHASDDVAHFANGGVVGGAAGSASSGGSRGDGGASMAAAMAQFSSVSQSLAQMFTQFGGNANALASAISQMPRSLSFEGTQNINVTHNGAEIFSSLMPAFEQMVVAKTTEVINQTLKRHMPDAGIPA